MTELPARHAAFRLEHTVRWNPSVPLARSITVDPPVTLEEARKTVADNLPALTASGTWSLMDGAQMIRSEDVVAIRIVPLAVPPDDAGEGFGGLTVVG
jgi:hypothetical protein